MKLKGYLKIAILVYILLFYSLVSGVLAATPPSITCQILFDDPEVMDIAVDSNDNIIAAGYEYIAKYDPLCNELWTREFYDYHADFWGVAVDPSDNIIVAGDLNKDVLIAKYNPSGTKLWHKFYDFNGWKDRANAVAVDSNGNIIAVGISRQPTTPWEERWIVLKCNSNGNELWRDVYRYVYGAEAPSASANDVAVDSNDNIIVTGKVEVHGGAYPDNQMLTIKYKPDGDRMWIRKYGTVECHGVNNYAHTVTVDSDDNIIIGGESGSFDKELIKYNSGGGIIWEKDYDVIESADVNSNDEIVIIDDRWQICMLTSASDQIWALNFVSGYNAKGVVVDSADNIIVGGHGSGIIVKYAINHPPNPPTAPSPADGADGISTSPSLSVYVEDPDGDSMEVAFYNASDDSIIGTNIGVENGTRTSLAWLGLDYGKTYSWYVTANDGEDTTQSNTWSFTTNNPPNTPSNPSPANHSTGQSINTDLSWTGGDPDFGDTVTYDVYFGNTTSPPLVSNDQPGTTYDPSTLRYNTKYYWKINATDNHGASTLGPLWDFTTGSAPNNPPNAPSFPSPADGATNVPLDSSLEWVGGDPDGDSVTYDVYLEAEDPTPDNLVASGLNEENCTSSLLNLTDNTKYFWKINATDEHGLTTEGPVWNFTTGSQFNVTITSPQNSSIHVDKTINFNCSVSGGTPPYNYNWSSNIDGIIGDKENFSTALSEGLQIVTLKVTDSIGENASKTIQFMVLNTSNSKTANLVRSEVLYEYIQGKIWFLWNTTTNNEYLSCTIVDIPSEFQVGDSTVLFAYNKPPSIFRNAIYPDQISFLSEEPLSGQILIVILINLPESCPNGTYHMNLSEMVGSDFMLQPEEIVIEVGLEEAQQKLTILQAKTDKSIYILNKNVTISCIVQNETGANITADSVNAKIAKPDSSIEWVSLIEELIGDYYGIFTNASLFGTYNVTIYANKTDYVNDTAELSFEVVENQLPIANFTYSTENPIANQTITFNASNSTDPDGFITKYGWGFGDGNITNTSEEIITHSYSEAGDYTVNLTVTDDGGATNTCVARITVSSMSDLMIIEKWVNWPDNCTICYNITNIGNGTAPACHNATLYVDGEEVAHDYISEDLVPNASYIGCFEDYNWTYTPPEDNITVCADNNNTVEESNETNNCLTNIWKCGDVNKDGRVTMSDVRKVYNRYLDPSYSLCNEWAGDVNCDGIITMSDVRKVYNRYLDPSYDLNCCCEQVIE